MVRPASDIQTIQRQFQDVHTLLMNVVDALSRNGNPIVSTAIQDVTRVSEKVRKLELGVNEHARVRQSQLGALMGIGRVINSSRGLQLVLEEVMDTLIALMRAERGFLMLRDPYETPKLKVTSGLLNVCSFSNIQLQNLAPRILLLHTYS